MSLIQRETDLQFNFLSRVIELCKHVARNEKEVRRDMPLPLDTLNDIFKLIRFSTVFETVARKMPPEKFSPMKPSWLRQ